MLTKIEECSNPWPILQMLNNKALPLSFESTCSLINDPETTERTIGKMIRIGMELLAAAASLPVAARDESARAPSAQHLIH